jgi:hypothetical protein
MALSKTGGEKKEAKDKIGKKWSNMKRRKKQKIQGLWDITPCCLASRFRSIKRWLIPSSSWSRSPKRALLGLFNPEAEGITLLESVGKYLAHEKP